MLQGSITALITPFLEDDTIDWKSFRNMVSWQIEEGTDALLVCGSTGESATLSFLEQKMLIETAVLEAKGRVPILAGTGSNDTRVCVEKTKQAKELGAQACLVIFPYYNKPHFEGCMAHFEKVSDCDFPIVIYNNPSRSGLSFSPQQLAQIAALPSVIGLKEASGDVEKAIEFMRLSRAPLFSGEDALTIPLLSRGAKGSISVTGNIRPSQWSALVQKTLKNELREAWALYEELNPICRALFLETNPQCIKYAMSLEGHCSDFIRLPLLSPQEKTKKEIEASLC